MARVGDGSQLRDRHPRRHSLVRFGKAYAIFAAACDEGGDRDVLEEGPAVRPRGEGCRLRGEGVNADIVSWKN